MGKATRAVLGSFRDITLTEQCLSQCSKAFTLALIIFPISVSHLNCLSEIHPAWLKFLGREGFLRCLSKFTAVRLQNKKTSHFQQIGDKSCVYFCFSEVFCSSSEGSCVVSYHDCGVFVPSYIFSILKYKSS